MDRWPEVKLKELCDAVTVGFVGSMADEYCEDGIPFLRSQNITPFQLNLQDLKYIPESFHERIRKSTLRPGDVGIVRTGYPGTACVIPPELGEANCSDLVIVRPGKELNPHFIAALFNSAFGKTLVGGNLVGAAQQHFNVTVAKELKLRIPPRKEQDKIAAVLVAFNDLIANNQRRIALLESMAEEIYREWFVRMRFPGADKRRVVHGVPVGWQNTPLRKLIKHYIGGGWGEELATTESPDGAFVLRGTDLPPLQNGVWGELVFRFHKQSGLASRALQPGDFVFEVSGGSTNQLLGRNLMVSGQLLEHLGEPAICASFCKLIRFDQAAIAPLWMKYFLKMYYESGLVGLYQVQSTGISNYQFEAFISRQTVLVPDAELQKQFCDLVEPMNEQRDSIARMNEQLKRSRDALLPRLISGKLRVDQLDIQFPPSMRAETAEAAP